MNTTCTPSNTIDLRNSSSFLPYVYLPYEWILYIIVWPAIALVGFVGNIMFIWTVIKVSDLHTSTFIVLAALACSDILSLIGRLIYSSYNFHTSPLRYGVAENTVAIIGEVITWFCFVMSTWLITLVSTERFLAICHPIKYRVFRGTKEVLTITGILFCGSICLASQTIPFSIQYTEYCIWWPRIAHFTMYPTYAKLLELHYFPEKVTTNYFVIVYIILLTAFVILFIVNCYMYTKTIETLITRKRNRTLQTSAQFERSIQQASVMVIANGLIFFVCLSIFALQIFSQIFGMMEMNLFDVYHSIILENITLTVLLVNASVNPFIYFVTNQHCRHTFKKMIRNVFCKPIDSNHLNVLRPAAVCDSQL